MTDRLSAGDTAPPFTLSDADGNKVSLKDYRGKRVILYFYPAASTPGCTKEACDFRDSLERLTSEGFAVLGVASGVWFVATATALGYQVTAERTSPVAIVLAAKTEARFAPLPDATVHFQLNEGVQVAIREDRGQWFYVERADGQQGWVKAETVERIARP